MKTRYDSSWREPGDNPQKNGYTLGLPCYFCGDETTFACHKCGAPVCPEDSKGFYCFSECDFSWRNNFLEVGEQLEFNFDK